jgi:hypothetical protein
MLESLVRTGHYRGRSKHFALRFQFISDDMTGYSKLALCGFKGLIDGPWKEILPMTSASANETSTLWRSTGGFG